MSLTVTNSLNDCLMFQIYGAFYDFHSTSYRIIHIRKLTNPQGVTYKIMHKHIGHDKISITMCHLRK